MRLEAIAKGGFYPTPPKVTEFAITYLEAPKGEARLLDPCSGDGKPAAAIGEALKLETYGVEIHKGRAQESAEVMKKVLATDMEKILTPRKAFSLLFLNPPYDYHEESKRLELKFLKHTTQYLRHQGILIYLIPKHRLIKDMAKYLAAWYQDINIYRFPDPEYGDFSQIVLFAVKKDSNIPDQELQKRLEAIPYTDLEPLGPSPFPVYSIPDSLPGKFHFYSADIDPEDALKDIEAMGIWKDERFLKDLHPPENEKRIIPLMPLKKGHLALLIASGFLNNAILEKDGERLLVKGRSYKVIDTAHEDSEEEGKRTTVEKKTDRIVTEIRAIDLNKIEFITIK